MDYMFRPYKRYVDFAGRSRRTEFWLWLVFTWVVSAVLVYVDQALGLGGGGESMVGDGGVSFNFHLGVLGGIFSLINFIPGLAVSVRRLHDTDRSGWWLLIAFLPLIGAIVLLVFFLMGGTAGPNRYGADPKGGGADANTFA